MELDDLPESWSVRPFDDVVTIRSGSANPAHAPDETFELFSIPAFDETGRPERKLGREIGSSKTLVQPGDCLFSKLNPRIPRTWVVPSTSGLRQISSTEFWPLRSKFNPKEFGYLSPEFLCWLFRCGDFLDSFRGNLSGGVQSRQRLQQETVRSVEIPVPPLPEQRRIVARVEALTNPLDQARQARLAALAEAASVFYRVLENEFSEEATEGWSEVRADQLFEIMSGQASPFDPQFKHLPYLGPEHIESGTGRIIGERVSVEELKMKSGKYVFTPEHVVYSKIRPALRKVCLPDYEGLCSADMYPLKPNAAEMTREFLLFLLLAPPFSQYAVDKSDRNAMPKINREALFGFTFRVPKKPEQKRIAKLLLDLRVKLDELQQLQREVEAELASFTPALLAKAFRGEL